MTLEAQRMPAIPVPTPISAVSIGSPAATIEPKVISSTTIATMTPRPSVDPMAGACATAPPPSSICSPSTSFAVAMVAISAWVASGISVICPWNEGRARTRPADPARPSGPVAGSMTLVTPGSSLACGDDVADGLLVRRFGQRAALGRGEHDPAGGVTGAGDLLPELVEGGLRRGAGNGERRGHGAGERGGGAAQPDEQGQPDDQHRPSAAGGEVSESVEQRGHEISWLSVAGRIAAFKVLGGGCLLGEQG